MERYRTLEGQIEYFMTLARSYETESMNSEKAGDYEKSEEYWHTAETYRIVVFELTHNLDPKYFTSQEWREQNQTLHCRV